MVLSFAASSSIHRAVFFASFVVVCFVTQFMAMCAFFSCLVLSRVFAHTIIFLCSYCHIFLFILSYFFVHVVVGFCSNCCGFLFDLS